MCVYLKIKIQLRKDINRNVFLSTLRYHHAHSFTVFLFIGIKVYPFMHVDFMCRHFTNDTHRCLA